MEQNAQERSEFRPIIDMGAATLPSPRGTLYVLTVIGQIEGHSLLSDSVKTTKYEHILPLLALLEESREIDGILLLLNTVGGDIEAGLAIAEMVAGMQKPTASLVIGGGHSIGVPLAVAAARTWIAPSASMTIHPVRTNGTVLDSAQTYRYFAKLRESIVSFVTEHSGIGRETFLKLMRETDDMASDVGSVLYGREAVDCGLIESVGTLHDAIESLYEQIEAAKQE